MVGDLQAHTILSVQQFLTKNDMTHPPYSLEPTPSNIFCFPRWKKVLKGKCFTIVEEVKQKMAEALKLIQIDKFQLS